MDDIYEQIRKLRINKGLTLKVLSEKTGLSVSFLSQVERSESSLAITSLQKIAEALEVPITQFFEKPSNPNFLVTSADAKPFQIEGSSAIYARLGSDFAGRKIEPLLVTVKPGDDQQGTYAHPGEEFYYLLSGKLIVTVEEKEYQLSAGDSFHFPSELSHSWYNPTDIPAQILCVLTPIIFS